MKYQLNRIILIGLCLVSGLGAMDGNDEESSFFTISHIPFSQPVSNNTDDSAVKNSAGYCALEAALIKLCLRKKYAHHALHSSFDIIYDKYASILHSTTLIPDLKTFSSSYQAKADELKVLNESSYITIFAKAYPKMTASVATVVGIIVMGGIACGAYALVQHYNQEQQEPEQDADKTGNQPPLIAGDQPIDDHKT